MKWFKRKSKEEYDGRLEKSVESKYHSVDVDGTFRCSIIKSKYAGEEKTVSNGFSEVNLKHVSHEILVSYSVNIETMGSKKELSSSFQYYPYADYIDGDKIYVYKHKDSKEIYTLYRFLYRSEHNDEGEMEMLTEKIKSEIDKQVKEHVRNEELKKFKENVSSHKDFNLNFNIEIKK